MKKFNFKTFNLTTLLLILLLVVAPAAVSAQIASGGAFTLQKSVTAGGGEKSSNGAFSIENTSGQSVAGQTTASSSFTIYAGFWTPEFLAPTAANAEIGGRVLTASGQGIRNAVVRLVNAQGAVRTTVTGNLGYYRFAEVEVGETYVLSAASKRFTFSISTQVISINDSRDDVNFIANPQ